MYGSLPADIAGEVQRYKHIFCNMAFRQVVFKQDTYKMDGNQVTRNGAAVIVPYHLPYSDGSVHMDDVGKSLDQSEHQLTNLIVIHEFTVS